MIVVRWYVDLKFTLMTQNKKPVIHVAYGILLTDPCHKAIKEGVRQGIEG